MNSLAQHAISILFVYTQSRLIRLLANKEKVIYQCFRPVAPL